MINYNFDVNSIANSSKCVRLNLHLTYECNCKCVFCLVPALKKNMISRELTIEEWLTLIDKFCEQTKTAEKRKIKFSGGEPLLVPFLGDILKYVKRRDANISLDFTTNAYYLDKTFLKSYKEYLDGISISIDSFDNKIINKLGRTRMTKELYFNRVKLVQDCGIPLRINTIIHRYNWNENMADYIDQLNICRWKLIQMFDTFRCNEKLMVTKDQFDSFVMLNRHTKNKFFFKNDNQTFESLYYAIAPDGKLFDLDNRGVFINQTYVE